jgi:hypothetical protein
MRLRATSFLLLVSLVTFASLATLAPPAAAFGGINLRWTDCGEFGIVARSFACNTNVGTNQLFASVIAPVPMNQLEGMEAVIDLQSLSASLPNFWQLGSGGCRSGALTHNFDFTLGPFNCGDPWQGVAAGGESYQAGFPFPNGARIKIVVAVQVPVSIDDVTEYYAFELRFSNAKAVGTGACAGCIVPVCLVLNQIKLVQPAGVGDYVVQNPILTNGASWQQYGANCPFQEVPVRATSWGAVKSLYR